MGRMRGNEHLENVGEFFFVRFFSRFCPFFSFIYDGVISVWPLGEEREGVCGMVCGMDLSLIFFLFPFYGKGESVWNERHCSLSGTHFIMCFLLAVLVAGQ